MKQNGISKLISHITFFATILLLAACISMSILFYGTIDNPFPLINKDIYNGTDHEDTTTYLMAPKQAVTGSMDKTSNTDLAAEHFILPESIVSSLFLFIIFALILLYIFKELPDEYTLVNQKVRLDN